MAARVEVVQGPDAGWRFTVSAGEVRIGRGAGHQIKLTDPALGDGHLRVQFRSGGYLVTNHMAHPVYLDGQLLAPGAQRTWYVGSGLQPTAGTLLRLAALESAPAPDAGGVLAEPPGTGPRKAKKSPTWEYAALAAIALGVGLVAVKQANRPRPPSPAVQFYADIAPALGEAKTEPGHRYTEAARRAVQIAVLRQSEGDLVEAKRCYLEAREVITAGKRAVDAAKSPATAAALERAGQFVANQLE